VVSDSSTENGEEEALPGLVESTGMDTQGRLRIPPMIANYFDWIPTIGEGAKYCIVLYGARGGIQLIDPQGALGKQRDEAIQRRSQGVDQSDQQALNSVRFFESSWVVKITVDQSHIRLLVPAPIRDFGVIGSKKKLAIAAIGPSVEVFARDKWNECIHAAGSDRNPDGTI